MRRRAALGAVLLAVVLILIAVNIMTGSSDITVGAVRDAIFKGSGKKNTVMIIRQIRLPMALMAAAVGASLGIGGCEIQTILRNPVASPYTLGITNAATFGAALGLILNTNVLGVSEPLAVTANSFLFAVFASVCIYAFSLRKNADKNTVILFGMAMNFLFNALTMALQYISDDEDLKSLVFWSMGSLLKTTWTKFLLVFAALVFCYLIFRKNAWKLTAMSLDDEKAKSLGVNTSHMRRLVILLVSLLTAFAICFVGSIGFVGIIAPHLARQLVGEEQRFFMPLSALTGAVVVSVSFTASKLLIPGVILPIGLVTAILGVPVFMAIIFGKMKVM